MIYCYIPIRPSRSCKNVKRLLKTIHRIHPCKGCFNAGYPILCEDCHAHPYRMRLVDPYWIKQALIEYATWYMFCERQVIREGEGK